MPFQFIKKLEQERGDLHQVIPALVNRYGQVEAGRRLGVSAATISIWLRRHGYRRITRYERVPQEQAS